MMICDAQVHIWAANTPERPWPADGHHARRRGREREPGAPVAAALAPGPNASASLQPRDMVTVDGIP